MSVRPVHALVALLALAVLAPLAAAAEGVRYTPRNNVLVIDAGKTATIKLSAEDGCKPVWSASSSSKSIEVADPGTKGAPKKSIKVSAKNAGVGAMGTITVTIDGVGENCDQVEEVEFMVFVVMKAKDVEKVFVRGSKGAMIPGVAKLAKDFRNDVKAEEKALQNELKQILADMKAGELGIPIDPNDVDPGPGGSSLNQYERALLFMSIAYYAFTVNIYALYFQTLQGMAFCGTSAMSLYFYSGFFAYFPLLAPRTMHPGGCGSWDQARLGLFQILFGSVNLMAGVLKKFSSTVRKEAAKAGEEIGINQLTNPPNDPGDGGTSPVAAVVVMPDANKPLELQRVGATNSFRDGKNSNGRITIIGRTTGANVDISIQKLDADGQAEGSPIDGTYPVDTSSCAFWVAVPPLGDEPDLEAGVYKITVTNADGSTTTQNVTVPVS